MQSPVRASREEYFRHLVSAYTQPHPPTQLYHYHHETHPRPSALELPDLPTTVSTMHMYCGLKLTGSLTDGSHRRKKCDKNRPACDRCLAGGFRCLGYDHIPTSARPKQPKASTSKQASASSLRAPSVRDPHNRLGSPAYNTYRQPSDATDSGTSDIGDLSPRQLSSSGSIPVTPSVSLIGLGVLGCGKFGHPHTHAKFPSSLTYPWRLRRGLSLSRYLQGKFVPDICHLHQCCLNLYRVL
jgi:hypothetical protein